MSVPPLAVAFVALSSAPRSSSSDSQEHLYTAASASSNGSPRDHRPQGANKRNLLVSTPGEQRAAPTGASVDEDTRVCPDDVVVAKWERNSAGRRQMLVHIRRALTQRNYVTLAVLAGSIAGVQTAWNSTFQSTLSGVASLSSTDIGWIAFANNSGYNAGEFCAAMFGERIFRRQLKRAIMFGLAMAYNKCTKRLVKN